MGLLYLGAVQLRRLLVAWLPLGCMYAMSGYAALQGSARRCVECQRSGTRASRLPGPGERMLGRIWGGRRSRGRVNLKVNRTPRLDRQLYPDPRVVGREVHVLAMYWLEVGGATPAKDEYERLPNRPQVLAALKTIDSLLMEKRPVPKVFVESFTESGVKLWEIKAPQRGKVISRLLAYRESDWNMFVAFAQSKKSNELPLPWKRSASARVRNALREGVPL